MTALPDGSNLLARLISEAEKVTMVWQLVAIAVSLALAWLGARQLRPVLQRLAPTADDGVDRPAAAAGAARVLMPLLAFVLLLCARGVLNQWMPVRLLDVAVPLASSLVIIRVAVYVLRHALPAGNWVRGSSARSRGPCGPAPCSTSPASFPASGLRSTTSSCRSGGTTSPRSMSSKDRCQSS